MTAVAGPSRATMPESAQRRHRRRTDFMSKPIDQAASLSKLMGVLNHTKVLDHCTFDGVSCLPTRRRASSKTRSSISSKRSSRSAFILLLISLLVLILTPTVLASEGDRSPEYHLCVTSCTDDVCRDNVDDGTMFAHRLPFILRLTRWTCEDDCKYHCTHRITNDAVERVQKIKHDAHAEVESLAANHTMSSVAKADREQGLVEAQLSGLRRVQKQMVQFHGKWVFIRFLGAQEPLSVLFSLLNLRVHWKALFMMRKQLPDAFPLKLVYIVHTLISINAWLWSTVFHTRDKDWTEKLDYFSAGSVIMSGFFFSACRLFRLAPGGERFVLFRRACIGALLLHILYLSVGRFDYAYNMTANVVVGLIHTLLWLTYSIRPTTFPSNPLVDRTAYSRAAMRAAKPSLSALSTRTPLSNGAETPPVPVSTNIGPPSSHTKQRRRLQLILALMSASVLLELLDFPPILRILDAHALWHLATVPITKMWYDWLVGDAQDCVSTGWWLSDRSGSGKAGELASTIEQLSEKLRGRAASLAQNIEINALTARLNELANKAGFSGRGGVDGGGSGTGGAAVGHASGLGLEMEPQSGRGGVAATSTSIGLGTTPFSSLTDRDASSSGHGKAKDW